jgi:hypothetical protein
MKLKSVNIISTIKNFFPWESENAELLRIVYGLYFSFNFFFRQIIASDLYIIQSTFERDKKLS